jgi:MFS family permease
MNIYSIKNKGVAGNIWKFFIISSTNKRTYMTFFSIFLLTMPNATAQTVGFVSFIGQLLSFIFEVPSGYISDKFGHKNALILGKIGLTAGTGILIFAHTPFYFILSQIFMALGFAMFSGTLSTFFQETLIYLKREDEYSSIMGKIRSAGYAIPIFFIILLPILAEKYGYQAAFSVALFVDVIGLITIIFLKNPNIKKNVNEFEIKENIFKKYLKIGWLKYVIFSELIFAILFAATVGFKNPFQESVGFSIATLGLLWATSRVGISLLLLLNGWFKKHLTLKKVIIIQGIAYIIDLLGVAFSSNKWVIAAFFIFGTIAMWGFMSVKRHFYLEFIKDSEYKASFLSINTFINKIISAGLSLLMGYLVLHKSYQFGFMTFGIILIIVILFAYFLLENKAKKRNQMN